MIAICLQSQYLYGGVVKTNRKSLNKSLWVGIRSTDYPSFAGKAKRGYPYPPAFCIFGDRDLNLFP
jgi:hypothetical protein